jgi:two-component system response regulator FixJ
MTIASLATGSSQLRPSSAPVFVVDDDAAVLDSLQSLLDAEGFAVAGFESGATALPAIARDPPACLVLDLHMPVLGGLELMDQLAARGIRLPVVVITGRFDRKTTQRALAAGASAVLRKPFDHGELVDAIDRALATGPGNAPAGHT